MCLSSPFLEHQSWNLYSLELYLDLADCVCIRQMWNIRLDGEKPDTKMKNYEAKPGHAMTTVVERGPWVSYTLYTAVFTFFPY